eukprot:1704094-Rhodomonas_salina.1
MRARQPVRWLGSWAAKFDAARSSQATLATRKALGDELQNFFKLEMEETKANAQEVEAQRAP